MKQETSKTTTLVCSPLRFYTQTDEELFFKWIAAIPCIKEFKGVGNALHMIIPRNQIPNADLLNLMGLFDRYKFDAKQLRVFMNESNKEWFED